MIEIHWSKAPEGATHVKLLTTPGRLLWFRSIDRNLWEASFGDDDGWHQQAFGPDADELIPRPIPQWRGPEDGLPPVGTVCEVRRHGEWVECEIVAHVQSDGVTEAIYQCACDWDWSSIGFRPLKSDKERAIDAAVAATILKDGPRIRAALSDIYDAGLLRLPEEQS